MRHLILREAGGMGDVVRTFPVLQALKRRALDGRDPGNRVEYVCLSGYEGLIALSGRADAVHTVSERERRGRDEPPDPSRHAYLRRIGAFEPDVNIIDLYCPAYRHEVETGGAVTLDRVGLFCRAAGVVPSRPRIDLPRQDIARARERLLEIGGHVPIPGGHGIGTCPPGFRAVFSASSATSAVQSPAARPLVGLAPYATHAARSWLGRERLCELGRLLRSAGLGLVMFHSWKCPRPNRDEGSPADAGAAPALRLGWRDLALSIAACDMMISVDTGPLHLAGALGVPTLGLFGCTSGEVICRPYPTHTWMTAPDPLSGGVATGCAGACHGRPSRGYAREVCGRAGCDLMNRITPQDIAHRALGLIGR